MQKSIMGVAIAKDPNFANGEQGSTKTNRIKISDTANDPRHTEAHEAAHFLMLLSKNNPSNAVEHDAAGGIFYYGKKDPAGNTVESTQSMSKSNVKSILKSVPKK